MKPQQHVAQSHKEQKQSLSTATRGKPSQMFKTFFKFLFNIFFKVLIFCVEEITMILKMELFANFRAIILCCLEIFKIFVRRESCLKPKIRQEIVLLT